MKQKEPDKLPMLEKWQAAGEINGRYARLEADGMALWQSILEWVRQIDGLPD